MQIQLKLDLFEKTSLNYQGGSKYRGAGFIQIMHKETYEKFAIKAGELKVVDEGYQYVAENCHGRHMASCGKAII